MSTFKPHPELLLDLANAENNSHVAFSEVTVSPPTAITGDDGDTEVTFTSTVPLKYTGSSTHPYHRLDFTTLFATADITTLSVATNATTSVELVEAIRDAYGLTLFADDIVDEPIVRLDDGNGTVNLVASHTSYVFSGSIEVAVSPLPVESIPLGDILTVKVLNGLNYPLMDTSALTPPATEVEALQGGAVKQDGTLLAGTGNPAGGFTVATNSEISLGLVARVYRSTDVVEPIEGEYLLDIPDAGDWNYTYSIGLDLANPGINPITSRYAVALEIKSHQTEQSVTFTLQPVTAEGSSYQWVADEDNTVIITDDAVSTDGLVTQNIMRLKFFAQFFQGEVVNTAGALTGVYDLTLTARRLNSIAPLVKSTIVVHATPVQPA
jgi:hypothetical protein